MSDLTRPRLDVFYIELLRDAKCKGKYDFPLLKATKQVPLDLISYSRREHANDAHWLHFYLDDYEFVFAIRYPPDCIVSFRRVAGVITPDFSLFSDMPLAMQIDAVFRGRVFGCWLQKIGVSVIPNVRWCDKRSLSFAFDGIPKGGTVAVGTHGCVREPRVKRLFLEGFDKMIERIHPKTIVVYGPELKELKQLAEQANVRIRWYPSEIDKAHPKKHLSDIGYGKRAVQHG